MNLCAPNKQMETLEEKKRVEPEKEKKKKKVSHRDVLSDFLAEKWRRAGLKHNFMSRSFLPHRKFMCSSTYSFIYAKAKHFRECKRN